MNKNTAIKMFWIASTMVAILCSFWFGGHIASNRTAKSIYGVQATLAFGHLEAYKKVYSYLDSNCKSQALAKLDFLIDEQKMLMAEYIQSTNDKKFEAYVSLRSPKLIDELQQYPINWNKKLTIAKCLYNK